MVDHCPYCGSTSVHAILLGESTAATDNYRCGDCSAKWSMVGDEEEGLRDKYEVKRVDGDSVARKNFVLLYETDPAARVALRAYAMATNNGVLAQDLDTLLNRIERRPEDFPIKGSEGILNEGVSSRHFESGDLSVLVIMKRNDDE